MDIKDLTPELKEKVLACKTPEELLALAEAEGYKLSDEELASINGGSGWGNPCNDHTPCTEHGEWC